MDISIQRINQAVDLQVIASRSTAAQEDSIDFVSLRILIICFGD